MKVESLEFRELFIGGLAVQSLGQFASGCPGIFVEFGFDCRGHEVCGWSLAQRTARGPWPETTWVAKSGGSVAVMLVVVVVVL